MNDKVLIKFNGTLIIDNPFILSVDLENNIKLIKDNIQLANIDIESFNGVLIE